MSSLCPGCVKPPTATCVKNLHLDFVDIETNCTGSLFRKKAIEKTILRILAQARFHTAWVISRSRIAPFPRPLFPQEQTLLRPLATSGHDKGPRGD